jgi:serine palmitoyltransferase
MSDTTTGVEHVLSLASHTFAVLEDVFYKIPGSAVVARYVKSSHQNDPGRTLLEFILLLFVIRTLLQSRTRTDQSGKHFIKFSEKVRYLIYFMSSRYPTLHLYPPLQEINELVDDWTPEPLCEPLDPVEQSELTSVPVIVGPHGPKPKIASTGKTALNLASFNFTGLASSEAARQRALDTLRKYGVGSCGPAGFYGTLGMFTRRLMIHYT